MKKLINFFYYLTNINTVDLDNLKKEIENFYGDEKELVVLVSDYYLINKKLLNDKNSLYLYYYNKQNGNERFKQLLYDSNYANSCKLALNFGVYNTEKNTITVQNKTNIKPMINSEFSLYRNISLFFLLFISIIYFIYCYKCINLKNLNYSKYLL